MMNLIKKPVSRHVHFLMAVVNIICLLILGRLLLLNHQTFFLLAMAALLAVMTLGSGYFPGKKGFHVHILLRSAMGCFFAVKILFTYASGGYADFRPFAPVYLNCIVCILLLIGDINYFRGSAGNNAGIKQSAP